MPKLKLKLKSNTSQALSKLSCDEFDEWVRPAPEQVGFEAVMQKALSRRDFFKGSAMLLGSGLFAQSAFASSAPQRENAQMDFGFIPVEANTNDTVTLPKGYRWKPVVSWGDPLWAKGQEFNPTTLTSADTQGYAFGDNNDGMESFVVNGKQLLAINNEYINFASFYANRKDHLPAGEDDILKAQKAVGVTIIEIAPTDSGWQVVQDSPFNRKITAQTPMDITGPARGHKLLQTSAEPRGIQSLGTWANCGSGKTPWGTYLTCEENFNTFYSCSDASLQIPDDLQRYGLGHQDRGYAWGQFDERFDFAKAPNEPNRSGYVVEIDPANPNARPKKRTALGRFKHENAEVTIAKTGQVVIYLGDDERGEFLYRYVSNNVYRPGGDAMDDLMENGTLYVAKFQEDGSGQWLPLTPKTTGMALAEICIHTRQAASKVGATTMDRPEWVAVNPHKAEAYCALTNNKNRGLKSNNGGDAQPVGGPNPREANQYGQIVRWIPADENHAAEEFHWNLFVMAGNPLVHKGLKAGSQNIHSGNLFNSPDGLSFDTQGRLWIQTDGKYSNVGDFEGMGNNQMLVADTQSGEIQRFMIGPKACEITGLTWSEDKKTLFVGIQHPGEKGTSNFPYGDIARSTVIAVWREDGKVVG